MKTLKMWKNGNRQIGVVEYPGQVYRTESGVFDGVNWQWRTIGKYATVKNAERSATKAIASVNEGWTAEPAWTQTI